MVSIIVKKNRPSSYIVCASLPNDSTEDYSRENSVHILLDEDVFEILVSFFREHLIFFCFLNIFFRFFVVLTLIDSLGAICY